MDDAAVIGYISKFGSLRDGTLRIQIDVQPADSKKATNTFCVVDGLVAIVGLNDDKAPQKEGKYSDFARDLFKDGFFRNSKVWLAAGTDAEYLAWLRLQDCSAKSPDHSGSIVPAHVRRVHLGAGTSIKPEYAAIAMCHHHHQMQHQHGESSVDVRGGSWEKCLVKSLEVWSSSVIKEKLGYASWRDVPPEELNKWKSEHGL